MKSTLHTPAAKVLSTMLCLSALAGCGAGGNQSQSDSTALLTSGTVTATPVGASTTTTAGATSADTAVTTATTPTVTAAAVAAVGSAITDVRFENTNTQSAQTNVPVTFGQVFAAGALRPADGLVGQLDDGSTVPLQVDVKALNADGSVRHAIISAILPSLGASQVRKMNLVKAGAAPAVTALATSDMMRYGFSASVHATINGVRYDAFADDLIKKAPHKTWLAGSVVNEWQVSAPLKTSSGAVHPHLSARFAIRWYQGVQKARVDVTVENDWAYEPSPQNFTYDARVLVGAKEVYAQTGLTHYHHARWRKTFWWNGAAPEVNIKHNTAYLIASRALPNYDQSVTVPETTLAAMKTKWTGAITGPMGIGAAIPYMPQTGGRGDIGLLPDWATTWLLSMDKRARDTTLGTADGAGSWSSHYRDRNTDKPVSLIDYPYMTIAGHAGDTYNPATKKQELFPACATSTACKTPYTHDPDHQPNLAYLPYLLTGDYYYLEELQFWAMWDAFYTNPGYRQNVKGLLYSEQVRGQAWSLRTLAEAAFITPDDDRLKAHFVSIVNNNLDWYNATYTNNAQANKLNAIVNGYSLVYNNSTGLAPWQDDFFTSAVGHANELGFTSAAPLLAWKAKFAVDRMTAPGACWIDGSIYALNVRASSTAPYYTTMAEAYTASHTATVNALACGSAAMATALKLKVGEMTGYSDTVIGYPSNMQPALAYAADALGASGKSAWTMFMNRTVKPNYGTGPQFAIVPR
ncbi:MAG: hypothetical protein ACXWC4_08120 [Telluria sp.]